MGFFQPRVLEWGATAFSDIHTMLCYAKSLQSCPTLCDPIDGSPPGFPVPGILQARTLEWVAIRKMQIKATVRYPLTPVRMVIIKMSRNKYW